MIELVTPAADDLLQVRNVLASWQTDDGAVQLHPGDLGWYSSRGPEATSAGIRMWVADGTPVALGLLDGNGLLRLAVDPDQRTDDAVANAIADDVCDPDRGILAETDAAIEARGADRLRTVLQERGWADDELWTPLKMDLAEPVPAVEVLIVEVGPDLLEDYAAVHWSAFRETPPTAEERAARAARFRSMMEGPFSRDARSLLAIDASGSPSAVITVWSAGEGRPGLIEPMGVHMSHRGHGLGRSITRAGCAALREMGASSALVCTDSARVPAIATYVSAGFVAQAEVTDLRRPG